MLVNQLGPVRSRHALSGPKLSKIHRQLHDFSSPGAKAKQLTRFLESILPQRTLIQPLLARYVVWTTLPRPLLIAAVKGIPNIALRATTNVTKQAISIKLLKLPVRISEANKRHCRGTQGLQVLYVRSVWLVDTICA